MRTADDVHSDGVEWWVSAEREIVALDFDTALGRRALRRLKKERIVWLTTVDAQGRPQPRPVWFHWNGDDVLIFSRPRTGKVRQLAGNPHASLHFNADEHGNDVLVFLGDARLGAEPVDPQRRKAYLRKYRGGIEELGDTPDSFLASYSVPIFVRPTALRGF